MAHERVPLTFPPGFRWGVATSSHQFEGDNLNNQWHAWEQTGHVKPGEICGKAADWWEHAEQDFDRARQMGLNSLRLSLEWSRIEPRPGTWDDAAIARYRQMLQGLRDRDLEPLVTLHHFTNPLWLEERGAFLAPDAVERFERYVTHAVEQLGDLCDFWCTINEPNVYSVMGYQLGVFPPGRKGDFRATVRVGATLARAHAAAYRAIHRLQPAARVGWAQSLIVFDPARPGNRLDRMVARLQDLAYNDFFPHAIQTGQARPLISALAGDLSEVRGTCDYVGFNLYFRYLVRLSLRHAAELFGERSVPPGAICGDVDDDAQYGELFPAGIERMAKAMAALGKPVYVTESGVSDRHDTWRPWVIARGVKAMHDALAGGVDLRGYYHWSLVDNFEWREGWRMRFGLFGLDERTQQRARRPSADLLGAIARANALTPDMVATYAPASLDEIFG